MKYADLLCSDCGPQPHMHFDASHLREREFEGVFFDITPTEDGDIQVAGKPEDDDYLADFNMPKLLGEAKEIIEDEDFGTVVCPNCHQPLE